MRVHRLVLKMPKEIVIPIPLPSLQGFLTFLAVAFIVTAIVGSYQVGKANGYFEAKLYADKVPTPEPVTVIVAKQYITETFKSVCAMNYGDEVLLHGCGWDFLGPANNEDGYIVGRKYPGDDSDCGGKSLADLADKDAIKKKWLQDGYIRFDIYPDGNEMYEINAWF